MQDRKFKLKNNELTPPFKTQYGWVIMKAIDPAKPKTENELRSEAKSKVMRDNARFQVAEDKLIEKIKKQYNFSADAALYKKFVESVGKEYMTLGPKNDTLIGGIKNKVLFSFEGGKVTSADLLEFSRNTRRSTASADNVEAVLAEEYDNLVKARLLDYEERRLADKYPDFKNLTKEYRDGILLFTITEQKVWRKAIDDSAGLRKYYEAHKNEFPANERVRIREYRSEDSSAVAFADSLYKSGRTFDQVDTLLVKEPILIRLGKNYYEKNSDKAKVFIGKAPGYRLPITLESSSFTLQVIDAWLPKGVKTFDEAKSECITRYQNQLEVEWLESLEEKYPVKINEPVLQNLFK